ncbi:hypothetical protein HAX54_030532, partial [Datura stramonium]|nr:hypothetical protein [Datura stramonium]
WHPWTAIGSLMRSSKLSRQRFLQQRVTGPDPRTVDAMWDPSSGLKPTVDWTGIPSVFHRTLSMTSRMSSFPKKFQEFQTAPD